MARKTLTQYQSDIATNLTDGGANTPGDVRTLLTDLSDTALTRHTIFYWQDGNAQSTWPGTSSGGYRVHALPRSGIYELNIPRYTVAGDRYLHIMVLQPSTINWIGFQGVTVTARFTARQRNVNPAEQLYDSDVITGTFGFRAFVDTANFVFP